MPTLHSEVREEVTQLQTTVYGVQGQGGLVRKVDQLETRVEDHEKRLNSISLKWLILMLLAGSMGNGLGAVILDTLKSLR